MYKLVSGYLVFDTITSTQTKAKELLEGWEHKEKITPVFAIVDPEDYERLEKLGELTSYRIPIFRENQLAQAKQELKEMNT